MIIANIVSYILVLLGAVNWGLYGIFDFNLVSAIFMGDRSVGAIITYIIIALAAIWLIIYTVWGGATVRYTRRGEARTRKKGRRGAAHPLSDAPLPLYP